MSTFNYADYQKTINQAKTRNSEPRATGNFQKVGFFKLKNDGDEALVRFNISTLDDLEFALIHRLSAEHKWMKVGCLNTIGTREDNCPFCRTVKEGNSSISPAKKVLFIKAMVSYKDPTTGNFSEAIPVIWERPASFSSTIATYLRDYGNLKEHVFKVTRNGAAGDTKTTYNISYIPLYDKPDLCVYTNAFDNYDLSRHAYWVKTEAEMNTFLTTGEFPEVVKKEDSTVTTISSGIGFVSDVVETPTETQSNSEALKVSQETVASDSTQQVEQTPPTRNFSRFSF